MVILECGGNVYDAVSLAVKAAISDTTIPLLTITENKERGKSDVELKQADDQTQTLVCLRGIICSDSWEA